MSLAVQFSKVLFCFWDNTFSSIILVYAHTVIVCYLLWKEKGDSMVESCSWQRLSLWSFAKISMPLLHKWTFHMFKYIKHKFKVSLIHVLEWHCPTCCFFSTCDHWCYSEMNRNILFINIKFCVQWVELFVRAPNVKLAYCLHSPHWISGNCHCVTLL